MTPGEQNLKRCSPGDRLVIIVSTLQKYMVFFIQKTPASMLKGEARIPGISWYFQDLRIFSHCCSDTRLATQGRILY